MKIIKILKCSDPLMWYRDKVGQEVPYLYSLSDCHMGREDCGLANIVMKEDCEIIIKNNKYESDL